MIFQRIQEKGILAKLLEQGIKIILKKECKKIGNLKIDLIASSIQIIKGEIKKAKIISEDINYKDLLFDEVELEANEIKINFKRKNKELKFKTNPKIKFRISFSENSLKTILLSDNWNWIANMISKEILNKERLKEINIINGQLFINATEDNISINQVEKINIKTEKGKVYLGNKKYNKIFQIPIEDKIYVENINIENNLIHIFANSFISF
tara:strand:+ start:2136 stop:2768 length:633 start_codon:yes stop_codon:yes gene_type:complete